MAVEIYAHELPQEAHGGEIPKTSHMRPSPDLKLFSQYTTKEAAAATGSRSERGEKRESSGLFPAGVV